MSDKLAFPMPAEKVSGTAWIVEQPGMTLREYAAIAAMQGMMAHPETGMMEVNLTAKVAVDQADALLAALAAKDRP